MVRYREEKVWAGVDGIGKGVLKWWGLVSEVD